MTFLAVRPRLSTVLSKFSHNFFQISLGCHHLPPEGVTRGGSPPSLLVTPLGAGPEMWGGTVAHKTMNVAGFYLLLLQ